MALALAVTACGDLTGPTGDRLSRAEALQPATMVMASSEGVRISAANTCGRPSRPTTSRTQSCGALASPKAVIRDE